MSQSASEVFDQGRITAYMAQRVRAQETIRQIEEGWTFHENQPGAADMDDVTEQRRREKLQEIGLLDSLIAQYEHGKT